MSLSFPQQPEINQQYYSDGIVWIWNGEYWLTEAAAGYTGSRGDAGYVGSASTVVGYTGSTAVGYTGSYGGIGFVGSQGATGFTGSLGDIGPQGAIGYTGSFGVQGSQGTAGAQGYQGNQGYQGVTGSQGTTGAQGYQGVTGSQGTTGAQGAAGSQGTQGYQGNQGATGTGAQGTAGTNGAQGYQGSIGYTGSGGTPLSRVVSYTDATSITVNLTTTDTATQVNTQAAGTLTINAPTGTPVDGQKLMFRLQATNAQTFAFNAVFTGSTDLPLPTTSSSGSKYDYLGFIYNAASSKWNFISKNFGF